MIPDDNVGTEMITEPNILDEVEKPVVQEEIDKTIFPGVIIKNF